MDVSTDSVAQGCCVVDEDGTTLVGARVSSVRHLHPREWCLDNESDQESRLVCSQESVCLRWIAEPQSKTAPWSCLDFG